MSPGEAMTRAAGDPGSYPAPGKEVDAMDKALIRMLLPM